MYATSDISVFAAPYFGHAPVSFLVKYIGREHTFIVPLAASVKEGQNRLDIK